MEVIELLSRSQSLSARCSWLLTSEPFGFHPFSLSLTTKLYNPPGVSSPIYEKFPLAFPFIYILHYPSQRFPLHVSNEIRFYQKGAHILLVPANLLMTSSLNLYKIVIRDLQRLILRRSSLLPLPSFHKQYQRYIAHSCLVSGWHRPNNHFF